MPSSTKHASLINVALNSLQVELPNLSRERET